MILLDAYGVLALAREESAADEVDELVRSGDVAMSAANVFEVVDQLVRLYGWTPNETSERLGIMLGQQLRVIALDRDVAWRGALLRARYYDRRSRALSLADCSLLASAGPGDSVVTSDPAVAAVARSEAIGLIPLPDSAGRRP